MAVPGPVTSDLSAGCHSIIRDWQGTLVTSADEVEPSDELDRTARRRGRRAAAPAVAGATAAMPFGVPMALVPQGPAVPGRPRPETRSIMRLPPTA